MKRGDTREDGFRFWSYYKGRKGQRLEAWCSPEVFDRQIEIYREWSRRYWRTYVRPAPTPESRAKRNARCKARRHAGFKPKRKGWPGLENASDEMVTRERARWKLRYAVKRGVVNKPNACESCGTVKTKREIEGHHFKGYDEPLAVRWLCNKCHRDAEAKHGN